MQYQNHTLEELERELYANPDNSDAREDLVRRLLAGELDDVNDMEGDMQAKLQVQKDRIEELETALRSMFLTADDVL